METTFICNITGTSAPAATEKGPLDLCPESWIKVTLARQVVNPKWVSIQQLKEAYVANILNQIPEANAREAQFAAVLLQVDANYAALEAATPKYVLEEEVAYLAPTDIDPSIQEAINVIRAALGLSTDAEDDEQDPQAQPEQKAKAPEPKK